jgi:ABC-type nickel/cobalt efflux system permease component RcnA
VRTLIRLAAVVGLAGGVLAMTPAAPASAHPLGNFTINLYSGIRVVPGEVRIAYVLDMAEIPTFQEMSRIDTDGNGTASESERAAWGRGKASEVVGGVAVRIDGRPLDLRVASSDVTLRPGQAGLSTLRLEATFQGPTRRTGTLEYRDSNYADRIGWREITAVGANGEALRGSSAPVRSVSDALRSYPQALLSSPLRITSATLAFHPGPSAPPAQARSPGSGDARPGVTGGAFSDLVARSGLSLPLVLLSLLLAAGFGALHALGPGHGKTITAAYLVGAGGRVRQALAAGGAVSAMHTASVLAVGLLVLSAEQVFPPEKVYPWLGLVSGVVIVGLGGFLLRGPLRDPDWHSHPHDHEHAATPSHSLLSKKGLAALAAAGGLLPSPTAVVVLLAAVALHRLAFGLALIMAFSVGLAGALTLVGVIAVRARDLFVRRMHGRLARLVPVGSAGVIVAAGAVLLVRGAVQL